MDTFLKDLERVREIATKRVAMFDAMDNSFLSDESNELFREYRELRRKYGFYSFKSELMLATSNDIWES